MDYRNTERVMEFRPRMDRVYREVLGRLKEHDLRDGAFSSPVPETGEKPFQDEFRENPDRPYVLNLANAIVRSWQITPVMIFPDEPIVGVGRQNFGQMEHFSWGINCMYEARQQEGLTEEESKVLDRMEVLTSAHFDREAERVFGRDNWIMLADDWMFSAGGYQGHTVCNCTTLLDNGLDGMLAKIDKYAALNDRDQESRDFYEACRIIIRGMSQWMQRYADEAARLAAEEADEKYRGYYEAIAENCAFVAHKKPETLYQAAQLMWCLSLWDYVDSIGRIDQFFYPYYEKAVKDGDGLFAEEIMTCIMLKIWEYGAHNATLGGVKPEDGTDATNELSFLFLQVLRKIHDTHPRMAVRIHKDSPEELLKLIVQIWSEGMSDPTVVSDETVIPGLLRLGVKPEDARDYATLGCQEIEVPGKSNTGCEDGSFNLGKVFEYTMRGGRSVKHPEHRFGPKTPEFTEFETFEDFFHAFEVQLAFYTEKFCHLCSTGQEIRGANHAKLVKGIFTDGVLEKGIPHDCGGPIYNYGVVETAGVAMVADSFTAIKKLVFEEKKIPKETLMLALAANFEGFERERQMLLNMAPKFGNDNDEADAMAIRVLNLFWDEIAKYRSVRGGVYTGACSLLENGVHFGKTMGAMPDGRFAGDPLGNSMGPRPGADKNGISAMLASVAKLPLQKGVGGTTLNVVLTTKLLSGQETKEDIAATMRSYLMNGGQMAQITTANLEDLLDAKVHPERHGNLIVRVGGFSHQFVMLEEAVQDEIISRY